MGKQFVIVYIKLLNTGDLDNITLPIDDIVKNDISINEYLLLYNVANNNVISGLLNNILQSLVSLEKKGFIKIMDEQIFLREKAAVFFTDDSDLFLKWLATYPTTVKRKFGGKRALSPASVDTILGKRLQRKWQIVFKKDIEAQKKAIRVLELQIKEDTKSGSLEYFVEATRWLNEGYHEKYSYLIEQDTGENLYANEDYL